MKDIAGYPNYQISADGLAFNKKTGRWLQPLNLTKGYQGTRLYHEGKGKTFKLHRLVALAYIPNPDNLGQVNHIDGDKLNNTVSNLEWCSNQENHDHAIETGLWQPTYTLEDRVVNLVHQLHAQGKSTRTIAQLTGVSKSRVHTLVNSRHN